MSPTLWINMYYKWVLLHIKEFYIFQFARASKLVSSVASTQHQCSAKCNYEFHIQNILITKSVFGTPFITSAVKSTQKVL